MTSLSLPLELLQQIAACVEAVHRSSLYAFSLTSKACHRASTFLVFQRINLTIANCEQLRHDVDKLIKALSRTDSARHVQRVSIRGALRLNAKKTDSDGQDTDWLSQSGLDEILIGEEPGIRYPKRYVVYDEPVIKRFSEEDMAWAPVVSLLHSIPNLKDLVYDCQSQFPPSLLSTLRGQHPQCRLHHLTFRFRTLLWGDPYPYEMELATFPSLYRLRVAYALWDDDGDDNFIFDAMMELVAGLAPNLKELIIVNIISTRSERWRRSRESWQGLPGFTGEPVGSLTSLAIKAHPDLDSPAMLQKWARCTDFACLQHLSLGGGYRSKSIGLSGETMEWITQNHSFPRLRTLSVYLTRNGHWRERPRYSENAASFFQAFEPLEELFVHGPMDSHIIHVILTQHGQKLKKLNLHPYEESGDLRHDLPLRYIPIEFTKDRILQIQAQCPVLEELSLPIKRNKSSASEVELYRCFAEMKCLRFLLIDLDCSNLRVLRDSTYNPQFEGDDQRLLKFPPGVKRGHLKENLINCAVDESLARSIWEVICQNKAGRQLERLKLWPTGGSNFGNSSESPRMNTVIRHLSRSWLIERVPRDDQNDITVRELGQHAREAYDREMRPCYSHESEIGQVFSTIWPCKEGSKDWRDEWSSFPLQV